MMESKPDYLGHRKRLRERFRKDGIAGMHDYEVLELLLTYALPRKDVKPLAKELIRVFGSFAAVFDASLGELEKIKQVGPISATLLCLIKEIGSMYLAEKMKNKDILSSPQAVLNFARVKLAGLPREAFLVIFLNNKNRVIASKIIQEGTIDRAIIYPRRLIEEALACHATGVILVHNHPSGEPEPSLEDKQLTRSLLEAARTIDLRILDHIIVGREGYCSFLEKGLLTGKDV
ncbi:MAG: RadC family protein [Thermodesulfobacteriota bacterium]